MSMRLSIVIVNWQTRDYLVDALASIFTSPPAFDFEVIVVDNNSDDGSAQAVRDRFPEAVLVANSDNAGYARGNNQGIERSTGELVLLLNPDVIVPPGALAGASAFMKSHPECGAMGPRLLNPDGSLQRSLRGFPTPESICWEALGLSRLFPKSRRFGAYRMTWFAYDREAEVDQPMGTFLLIRRECLGQVGLLDEQFPIFFNEVDWCFRARRAGWRILFTPAVQITHYGGGSTSQVSPRMAWESRRSLLDYFRKHYPQPSLRPLLWMAAVASWVQASIVSRRRSRSAGGGT